MTMTAADPSLDLAGLMREHQSGIWRYLRALGADPSLADDITQETFLQVHEKPFEQRTRGETASYLRTVARNQFLKSRRNAGKHVDEVALKHIEGRWTTLVEDNGEQMQAALKECLGQLDDKPKQALDMQYKDGKQRVEIAESLGMTDDGVKTLLARTKARLRKCMELRLGSD
jgi:RNA polymerase sigma-70 factor (ECF subfamily)